MGQCESLPTTHFNRVLFIKSPFYRRGINVLRSAFVLSMGIVGSSCGLVAASAIPCGMAGYVIGSVIIGVIFGWIANRLFLHFVPARTLTRRPTVQKTRREAPPADFRRRLSAFTNLTISGSDGQEDDFRSGMPFWAGSLPSTATPAKSSRLVRLILLRIRQILRS